LRILPVGTKDKRVVGEEPARKLGRDSQLVGNNLKNNLQLDGILSKEKLGQPELSACIRSSPLLTRTQQEESMINKLPFGKTGHLSTRTLFGAAAFYQVTQAQADKAMEVLFEYGVNHIDTAASYGDSEIHLGPWIEKYRSHFFLASKTGERYYKEARESIHRSLERLRTDHLDLIQLHAVVEDSEWDAATGPGGALEAAIAAREEGLVSSIGITSHSLHAPAIHLKSLERFDFDSVLLPYNYMLMQNPAY